MKKTFILLILLLSLCACGSKNEENNMTDEPVQTSEIDSESSEESQIETVDVSKDVIGEWYSLDDASNTWALEGKYVFDENGNYYHYGFGPSDGYDGPFYRSESGTYYMDNNEITVDYTIHFDSDIYKDENKQIKGSVVTLNNCLFIDGIGLLVKEKETPNLETKTTSTVFGYYVDSSGNYYHFGKNGVASIYHPDTLDFSYFYYLTTDNGMYTNKTLYSGITADFFKSNIALFTDRGTYLFDENENVKEICLELSERYKYLNDSLNDEQLILSKIDLEEYLKNVEKEDKKISDYYPDYLYHVVRFDIDEVSLAKEPSIDSDYYFLFSLYDYVYFGLCNEPIESVEADGYTWYKITLPSSCYDEYGGRACDIGGVEGWVPDLNGEWVNIVR